MALTTIEIVNGILALIWATISIIIGIIIASRYRKYKQNVLIYVGLSWIGIANGWFPTSISFILALTTGNGLTPVMYFLIGNAFIPVTLFIWMIVITELMYKEKQKVILLIFAIIGILFDIYLIYYLINDPSVIGELQGPVDVQYKSITALYLIFILLTTLVTGLLFAREAMKSDKAETRLKGKFLAAAFISYTIGAITDAVAPLNFITLPLIRILLITSAIEFYIGWMLPEMIKNRFIKQ
jgi:hypothetical protein